MHLECDMAGLVSTRNLVGTAVDCVEAALLPRSYRARGLAAEIAAHGDALGINRPGELTAESSAAQV